MTQDTDSEQHREIGARWADLMIRLRWPVILLTVLVIAGASMGALKLPVLTDYRAFFSEQNPELQSFEEFQATYTKTDNFFFLIKPKSGDVFTQDKLSAIEEMTTAAWQIPFAKRVDSLTNFQYTYGTEDDLIVEDLFENAATWTDAEILRRKDAALAEPLLKNLLVTADGGAAGVNVLVQLPGESITELPAAYKAAHALRGEIMAQNPDLDVHLSGIAALNNAFANDGPNAMARLLPIMFLAIFILAAWFLRSIGATAAMMVVVMFATAFAMGVAGFLGIGISPISAAAPIVILTLAVADCVHIMTSYRAAAAEGLERRAALVEAVRTNLVAVSVTSLTTVIGFLALNFSDAPPFRALGNMSAIGIAAAWALSLTVFPALASFVPLRVKSRPAGKSYMRRFADMVVANRGKAALFALIFSAGFVALIPTLKVNDVFTEYFDEQVEFRRENDVVQEYFGPMSIDFSVPGGEAGSVSEPEYLRTLDAFVAFLRSQPQVTHVFSFSDIMKRLNRNMNGDDPAFHVIPEDRNLAAQYLLLYELSLPYGLDLNDRINVDKSASRVTASFGAMTTQETKEFLAKADGWFSSNAPAYAPDAASPQIMFTYIADRNLQSMIAGTAIAVIAISIVMMLALRSLRLGLLSLIPNALPILSAFGAWALMVGEVGFSVAAIGSISLGIVVDDTVHFLSKYRRALREKGLTPDNAIRYAFENVGAAIFANTIILVVGFLILTLASFKPTVDLGLLTATSLAFALVLDFLLLPALLLWFGGKAQPVPHAKEGLAHAA